MFEFAVISNGFCVLRFSLQTVADVIEQFHKIKPFYGRNNLFKRSQTRFVAYFACGSTYCNLPQRAVVPLFRGICNRLQQPLIFQALSLTVLTAL